MVVDEIARRHALTWAMAPGQVPDTLQAVLTDVGRLYLPWVSAATVHGEAEVAFGSGARVTIRATDFLKDARATLLGRYRALRSDALDTVLRRAGILRYFADHLDEAGPVPTWDAPPQPRLNRPYPPDGE